MKRITVLLVALVAVGGAAPSASAHAPRRVTGTVWFEAPTPDVARCAWIQGREASQGIVGWVVPIKSHEREGKHTYDLLTWGVSPDLGIVFVDGLGTCTSPPRELRRDSHWTMWTAGLGFQKGGTVPKGARYAVIGHWAPGFSGPYYTIPPYHVWVKSSVAASFVLTIA